MTSDDPSSPGLPGRAVRPLMLRVIVRLRPDLDPVAVGGAVERIALCAEDPGAWTRPRTWQEVEDALTELCGPEGL
jgi:hypothetical protein